MPNYWTEKYKPETLSEVAGQNKAIKKLKKFVNNFKNQKKKAVLLHGPPGSGKTVIVKALASDYDLDLIELDASDLRNRKSIEELFGAASKQASLLKKSKILFADEIDGLSGRKDRGGTGALKKVIKETNFPVILTANDPYASKLRSLRKKCKLIKMRKLNYLSIRKRLRQICEAEGISHEKPVLKKLAAAAEGDLRAAINDLQTIAQGQEKITDDDLRHVVREKEESIFNALKIVFKSKDLGAAFDAANDLSEDLGVLNYWIDENVYKEYKRGRERSKAYNAISLSDIFLGRIRRWQHWRFLVYSKALTVAGVQKAKSKSHKGFVMYKRPKIMNWMFQKGRKRRKIKGELKSAGEKLHASSSRLNKSFWPYYKFIKKHNNEVGNKIDEWLDIG